MGGYGRQREDEDLQGGWAQDTPGGSETGKNGGAETTESGVNGEKITSRQKEKNGGGCNREVTQRL